MKGHNWGICRKCLKFHKHPRGMLGKTHSDKIKEIQREKFLKDNPMNYEAILSKIINF